MRIFLDTSVLSDLRLPRIAEQIVKQRLAGDVFYLSVITHFQVLWGYLASRMPTRRYERLLEIAEVVISPLTKADAEEAARMRPNKNDLLDALIAASAKRHGASVWTSDRDFLKFLPRASVRLL